MPKPPIRKVAPTTVFQEMASKAIETASSLINLIIPGPLIVHRHPDGISIDVPVLYNGVALDRIHFDLNSSEFSPKGRPVVSSVPRLDEEAILEKIKELFKELRVLDAAEFREPENCWVVPVAWGRFIVAHIKVSSDGSEIVPDHGLTAEVSSRIA